MKPADEQLAAALAGVDADGRRASRSGRTWTRSRTPTRPRSAACSCGRCLSPVRWEETMRGLLADGRGAVLRDRARAVLAGLLKRVNRKVECRNVAEQ